MSSPCTQKFPYTTYPCELDNSNPSAETLPLTVDNRTPVEAIVVNRHRNALLAIENELGINPSGTYLTVKARLDALEAGCGGGGGGSGRDGYAPTQKTLTVLYYNQTVFTLGIQPSLPSATELFVNGIKYRYGVDYTLSGMTITWSGTPILLVTDIIDVIFFRSGTGAPVQETFIATPGQTLFYLGATSVLPYATEFFVNGIKNRFATDYNISGATVTYLGSPILVAGDVVDIIYYIASGSSGGSGAGTQTLAQTLALGNNANAIGIVNMADPINPQDAATKAYVDAQVTSHDSLTEVLSHGNITDGYDIVMSVGDSITSAGTTVSILAGGYISGTLTVDGYTLINNDLAVTGKLYVDGLIDPTGMVLTNQVSVPGGNPDPGKVALWTRDSDGYLVQTDSSGREIVIGPQTLAQILLGGNSAENNTIKNIAEPVDNQDVASKNYVDVQVAAHDSLAEVLSVGNITGGYDIEMSSGTRIVGTDEITIDGADSLIGDGGDVLVNGGSAVAGVGGAIGGQGGGSDSGDGGNVYFYAGNTTSGNGGAVIIKGGYSDSGPNGGYTDVYGGDAGVGDGGDVRVIGGGGGLGGSVSVIGGNGSISDGGDVFLTSGTGAIIDGYIIFNRGLTEVARWDDGGSDRFYLTGTEVVEFAYDIVAPIIRQEQILDAPGNTLTIQAQNSNGGYSGGDLLLCSGCSTSSDPRCGAVTIYQGNIERLSFAAGVGGGNVTLTLNGTVGVGGSTFYVDGQQAGDYIIECVDDAAGPKIGFLGNNAVLKPTVSGARNNPEAALANLLTALDSLGLIADSTTAS